MNEWGHTKKQNTVLTLMDFVNLQTKCIIYYNLRACDWSKN